MTTYDPEAVRSYFDAFGDAEWDRLDRDLRGRISYLVHRRFLLERVTAGCRALDVGCGPGRFALDMAAAGARVSLVELSSVQLELAGSRFRAAGFTPEASDEGDVCELDSFVNAPFDLVVAYGGVLSYTYDRHTLALDQLVQATELGGHLLLSVMPLGGTMRLIPPLDAVGFLEEWEHHMTWDPESPRPPFVLTVPGSEEWHQPIALFTAAYLRDELGRRGCDVLTIAAASPLSTLFPMPSVEASAEASERFTRLELALCDNPYLAESGTHMIVVARRR